MAAKSTGNYIFKHQPSFPCKIVRRFDSATVHAPDSGMRIRGFILRICECGKTQEGKLITGKYSNSKDCDARCMGSKGPSCECKCQGMNHGGSHAA